jgi:3-oxoacyl-[acyl-carrier-protein] synthase-3
MKMAKVYITKTSNFLPNSVVSNDEMEEYLGLINGNKSRSKALVLRSNKIQERYYALTKEGKTTHTNTDLTALAVKKLFTENPDEIKDVDLLCCGTSSPDQMMPAHAVMVHGKLPEMNPIEVITPAGNCCAGMHALKYAYMSLQLEDKSKAVCTGSERSSVLWRSENYEEEIQELSKLKDLPYLAFEKDFLRWMLSDGAGAFKLENKPNKDGISLEVNWMESVSFANQEEACMYQASEKMESGELKGFAEFTPQEVVKRSINSIKQDARQLDGKIVELSFVKVPEIFKKHNFSTADLDYFLVHMSSFYFEDKIAQHWDDLNMHIPKEKWFTNLSTKGNVGAGSIYLMVDELFNSGRLKKGEKILLVVPESARFSYVYCLLTVC